NVLDQPIEVNRPTPTTHHIAILPPTRIAIASSATTIAENIISMRPARDLPSWKRTQQSTRNGKYICTTPQPRAAQSTRNPAIGNAASNNCLWRGVRSLNSTAPINLPISIPPQYRETYLLASNSVRPATVGCPKKLMIALPTETSPPTYMKMA